jgi:ABC-type branched-subunit amino acid transport system ATPase component
MIDTESLTRKFGDLTVVENLTLHVDEGLEVKILLWVWAQHTY